VQKAFKIKPGRGNKYFKGVANISMISILRGPNISIFLDQVEQK